MVRIAFVVGGVAERAQALPGSARHRDTGAWVCPNGGLENGSDDELKACGYYRYEPADPPSTTGSQVAVRVGPVYDPQTDTVIDTWTVRDKTTNEVATDTARTNQTTLTAQALDALATNRAFIASTPTNTQVVAAVKALARQNNGLIRLLLGRLDATD